MADDHHVGRAIAVFLRPKAAAHGRLHAEDVQKIVARLNAEDALWRARAGEVHARRADV